MNRKNVVGLGITVILCLVVFASGCASEQERTIQIAGSTSVQPVAEKLAKKFEETHPNVKINVQGGGSGLGIKSATQGIVDIGTSSKELTPEEKNGLKEYLIGKDGIVIALNIENPVSDLTKDQLKDIFSGKITNWREVGGPDAEIHVITREAGSGTRKAFEEIVMGKDTKIRADAIVQSSTEAVKQSIKQDPNAIGFVSLAHMSLDVKALKIDGVEPSEQTVADGSYKLQRPFLFLVKGEPKGIVKEFIDWVLSPEGQAIVKEEKVVPAK